VPDHPLTLLAVFAHPDDEAYRPGGTLALLAQRGARVHLLTATRGQAGSCGEPLSCSPEELPAVRERELHCSCAALGIGPPRLLDYQDGHLSEINPEEIVAQILKVVAEVRPQVLLSFGPDGLSGHPDHIAIGQCATEAFRRAPGIAALYTVAVPRSLAERLGMTQVRAAPDETITLAVDVTQELGKPRPKLPSTFVASRKKPDFKLKNGPIGPDDKCVRHLETRFPEVL